MGHALTLAYDLGPGVGMGHRRRMEALAVALDALGVVGSLVPLHGAALVDADVAVVDSYRVRADGSSIRARRRVAIDELGRDLDVDLLVDPSPLRNGPSTRREGRSVLRGLAYALLDPELAAVQAAPAGDAVRLVLVTTGAADAAGVGGRVAGALAAALPDVEVRLVEGPWGRNSRPPGVTVVHAPDGLIDELGGAGIVVTAAGVTMLEALALGRPTVAFAVADNQRPYLDGLASLRAVEPAASSDAPDAVVELARDAARRERLAAAGRRAVDGAGASRVAQAVAELL